MSSLFYEDRSLAIAQLIAVSFDGEWQNTWNDQRGTDLYNYIRNLQPEIIIYNRAGAAREGMEGLRGGNSQNSHALF